MRQSAEDISSQNLLIVFSIPLFIIFLLCCSLTRKKYPFITKLMALLGGSVLLGDIFYLQHKGDGDSVLADKPFTVPSCSNYIPVLNDHFLEYKSRQFDPCKEYYGALVMKARDTHKNISYAWINSFRRKFQSSIVQLNQTQHQQLEEFLSELRYLYHMLLTFKSFDPSIGGACYEHATPTLFKKIKPMIKSNWTETYPVQMFTSFRSDSNFLGKLFPGFGQGHVFIVTHGLGEKKNIEDRHEIEAYFKKLASKINKKVFFHDTWMNFKEGGICAELSELYALLKNLSSPYSWDRSNLLWFYFGINKLMVSIDYGQRLPIPKSLPLDLQSALNQMLQEVEQAILATEDPKEYPVMQKPLTC